MERKKLFGQPNIYLQKKKKENYHSLQFLILIWNPGARNLNNSINNINKY